MLVVDSSVWIDFFNDAAHPAVDVLAQLLEEGEIRIVVPDLVLFEVLRGFRREREYRKARELMHSLDIEASTDIALADEAAQHYRILRARGITVRSSIDALIATFCIDRGYALLHSDRDYQAFESLRGLRSWMH